MNKTQMAQHLNCSVRQITNLMRNGLIPYVKFGNRMVRFSLRDCDKSFHAMRVKSIPMIRAEAADQSAN